MYTDDDDLGKLAAKLGLKVVTLADLPHPIILQPSTADPADVEPTEE